MSDFQIELQLIESDNPTHPPIRVTRSRPDLSMLKLKLEITFFLSKHHRIQRGYSKNCCLPLQHGKAKLCIKALRIGTGTALLCTVPWHKGVLNPLVAEIILFPTWLDQDSNLSRWLSIKVYSITMANLRDPIIAGVCHD